MLSAMPRATLLLPSIAALPMRAAGAIMIRRRLFTTLPRFTLLRACLRHACRHDCSMITPLLLLPSPDAG